MHLSELRLRLRALFRRSRVNQEIEDELAFHQELLAQKLSREEIRREFGSAARTAEELREVRGWPGLERLWQDLRLAFRHLRLNPGFAIGAILPLAVAIAFTSGALSLADAVLFRSTGVRDASQVAAIYGFS